MNSIQKLAREDSNAVPVHNGLRKPQHVKVRMIIIFLKISKSN